MSFTPFDRFFVSRHNGRERPAILRHRVFCVWAKRSATDEVGLPTRLLFPRRVRPLEMVFLSGLLLKCICVASFFLCELDNRVNAPKIFAFIGCVGALFIRRKMVCGLRIILRINPSSEFLRDHLLITLSSWALIMYFGLKGNN